MIQPESAVSREPSSECGVRFRDCDPFGHLHNTRFADYLLDAREDHLRDAYGINLTEYATERNLGWVVALTKIAFVSPVHFSERIRIFTRLTDFSATQLHVEARMYGCRKDDLKALLWWSFRAIDPRSGAKRDHDDEAMRLFESVVYPLPVPMTFEERVKSVPRTLQAVQDW